jgi:hypothetical protein
MAIQSSFAVQENIANAAKIANLNVVRMTHILEDVEKEEYSWYEVNNNKGYKIIIGRAAWNKPNHFNIYPEFPKDNKNQSCKPYNKESISYNILKDTKAERLAKALIKAFNENKETFEESFTIQHDRNQYNNTVQNAVNDLATVNGWKKSHKEYTLTTIGMDNGYGDCEVYNDTCNLHINNVSHEVAKKIMELIRN